MLALRALAAARRIRLRFTRAIQGSNGGPIIRYYKVAFVYKDGPAIMNPCASMQGGLHHRGTRRGARHGTLLEEYTWRRAEAWRSR